MKRILITLRHPGPVQSIAAVLPYLVKHYEVMIIATDTGLSTLIMRFGDQIEGIKVFYLCQNQWKIFSKRCEDWKNADILEFEYEVLKFDLLRDKLVELIQAVRPDVVLRTTPAIKIGIDEIIVEVCSRISSDIRCLCYQEDYGCGIDLERMQNPIAVVDIHAQQMLKRASINSVVVGCLGQSIYKKYKPYCVARSLARGKLGIRDDECVVLYSIGASRSFELELEHFTTMLNRMNTHKVYYKFHPRNTDAQRKMIQDVSKERAIMLPEFFPYEETISFPDFILSIASALNQDSLQYQIECNEVELHTISVYTKGKISSAVLLSTLGVSELPHLQEGMGSIIINEEDISDNTFERMNVCLDRLFSEVKQRFGIPENERLDNLINYIEGV